MNVNDHHLLSIAIIEGEEEEKKVKSRPPRLLRKNLKCSNSAYLRSISLDAVLSMILCDADNPTLKYN